MIPWKTVPFIVEVGVLTRFVAGGPDNWGSQGGGDVSLIKVDGEYKAAVSFNIFKLLGTIGGV